MSYIKQLLEIHQVASELKRVIERFQQAQLAAEQSRKSPTPLPLSAPSHDSGATNEFVSFVSQKLNAPPSDPQVSEEVLSDPFKFNPLLQALEQSLQEVNIAAGEYTAENYPPEAEDLDPPCPSIGNRENIFYSPNL